MIFPHGETVTVIPQVSSGDDEHGNPDVTYGAEYDLPGCAVYDRSATSEPTERGRTPVAEGLTVLAPVGAAVGPHDRARFRGELYEVDGFPFLWRNPFTGSQEGVQFDLERVSG